MNINNLKEQQIIKNYKQLCDILGVKPNTGKSKILQHKEFERYFRYHKIANCYIIDEIYNLTKEKEDKRKDVKKVGNNNKYSKNIQTLIIDLLAQSKDERVCLSVGTLLDKLEMVNDNYLAGRQNIPKLSEVINVPEENCYDFYNYTQKNLKTKLESALNGLRRRALIMWTTEIVLCIKVPDATTNEYDTVKLGDEVKGKYTGTTSINYRTEHRKATKAEKRMVLRAEKEVLEELGFFTLQGIFLAGGWNIFKDKIHKKLWDVGNIEYYYTAFEIVYNYDHIYEELTEEERKAIETLEAEERSSKREILNKDICKNTIRNAKTRSTRIKNKVKNNEPINHKDKILTTDDYIKHTETLTNTVVNIKTASMKQTLKQELESLKDAKQITLLEDDLPF